MGSGGFENRVEVPFEVFAVWLVGSASWDGDRLTGLGVELLAVAEFAAQARAYPQSVMGSMPR
jgi:hypothetical protein